MSAEPMIPVERTRQFLCVILGRLDLAIDPPLGAVRRTFEDLRAARRAAEALARMCDEAERAYRSKRAAPAEAAGETDE